VNFLIDGEGYCDRGWFEETFLCDRGKLGSRKSRTGMGSGVVWKDLWDAEPARRRNSCVVVVAEVEEGSFKQLLMRDRGAMGIDIVC